MNKSTKKGGILINKLTIYFIKCTLIKKAAMLQLRTQIKKAAMLQLRT